MGAQENKDFIRSYLEAVSGKPKPPELVDQFIAEQPLKDHIAGGEQGFPAYTIDMDMMVAEDDLVSVIGRFGGTHTGPFMGIPATGKTASNVPFHITYRVGNGKIVDHWLLMDSAALMQQLGLVPSAAGTD
jgi:predicted ester cyclase